jgi:hypothetical protein
MGKVLEFEFEGGGRLRLELLEGGELLIRLQATHPGDGWRTTSATAAVDAGKVEEIRKWLGHGGAK